MRKRRNSFKFITPILMVLALPGWQPAQAGELSVEEIINKTNQVSYYKGKDGRARVSMTIKDKQGRIRKRNFTILRRDDPSREAADQKLYVYFHRPADVNKMVFLVWKHVETEDDRWLYLPALDLVKRIAATDKRTSFVGSDFFYEDISGRNVNADNHELIETTKNYYVLKNSPKEPETVEFAYYKMWIHKKSFIPVKIAFFDKQDKKYRLYEALKVETIQGYPTVTKNRMKDLRTQSETVTIYSEVKYDVGFPENIFSERYLRRAPTKYLK